MDVVRGFPVTMVRKWRSNLRAFGRDESGATSIEYGLIAALMAVAIIASLKSLGNSATGSWGSMANKAGNAMTGR